MDPNSGTVVTCWMQQVTTRVGAVTCWIQQPVSHKQVVGFSCAFDSEVDHSLPSNICQIQATPLATPLATPPPSNRFRASRHINPLAKGLAKAREPLKSQKKYFVDRFFQNFPNASECIRKHPGASEHIQMHPNRSRQVPASPTPSTNLQKLAETLKTL